MDIRKQRYYCILAGLVLGIIVGAIIARDRVVTSTTTFLSQIASTREKGSNYKFINPLLTYDLPESTDFGSFKPLDGQILKLVNDAEFTHKAGHVSVYFRDSNGHWVGVNENEQYDPASMMKVVIMIAYYNQAQSNPAILQKRIQYTSQVQQLVVASNPYDSPSELVLNQSYTIDDLVQKMIIDSDNGAAFSLLSQLDDASLNEVYTDLGLPAPSNNTPYVISVKDYSLFLRILYNATYLNRAMSEKALQLLSQATFKDGLVAGVPQGTVVAHKYGEHVTPDSKGNIAEVQLHDCGFVYAQNPYLLCVMTKGTNLDDLKGVIKDISSLVYQQSGAKH